MDKWLAAALDYVPEWIGFQMRISEQPGCAMAIAHKGKVVFEQAWGYANQPRGQELTPRHRHRVASHSKSFTAAGILKLREKGKLQLDDPAGKYVKDLHPSVAKATVAQLLSHTAGIIRDGKDTGQWTHRRPFLSTEEFLKELAEPQPIEANLRMKYSNHGFGLAGHLASMLQGSGCAARLSLGSLPALPGAVKLFSHGEKSTFHDENAKAVRAMAIDPCLSLSRTAA